MSQVTISGNAGGTGIFTIASPNSNNNRTLTLPDATGTIAIQGGAGVGKVLQVVSATKADTFSLTGLTWTDVPGLSVSITPANASNKILILANVNITGSARYGAFRFVRGATVIGVGDASGNRAQVTASAQTNASSTNDEYVQHNSGASFLDTPNTTNSLTYKLQIANTYNSGGVTYINRPVLSDNDTYTHLGISTITVMEVAA